MGRKISIPSSAAALVSLAVAVLAVAGCGGGTKTVTSTPLPPGVERAPPTPQPKNATYHVVLNGNPATKFGIPLPGFPRGQPNGSARALVATNAATLEFCWQFSQLKNIRPIAAKLFRTFSGATGRNGKPLGRGWQPSGCFHLEPTQMGVITSKPQQFFLSIHTARYPYGAVRGQL